MTFAEPTSILMTPSRVSRPVTMTSFSSSSIIHEFERERIVTREVEALEDEVSRDVGQHLAALTGALLDLVKAGNGRVRTSIFMVFSFSPARAGGW